MAITVAALSASLGLESSQFQTGLNSASGTLSKFASSAQGHAASAAGAFDGISSRAVALGNILSGAVMGGLNAVAGAFGSLQQGMIGGNAEFERYQTQFGVLLKSTDAAKQRLEELAKFGAETPFELPEVVRADKILQGFGLHAADTAKKFGMSGAQIRTVAGDVAAGTGAKFEEISTYLGKFSTGATGEAIARMQELGITTRAELAGMGVAFSKSGEMTSPVEVGMSALLQVMQTKFGGMMQAQSSTFEGMMSNLQDWVGQAMRVMGAPIFDALKGQLSGLLKLLGSPEVQTALVGIGQALGNMASTGISALSRLGAVFGPIIQYFTNTQMSAMDLEQALAGIVGSGPANALADMAAAAWDFGEAVQSLASGNLGDFAESLASSIANVARSMGLADETATTLAVGLNTAFGSAAASVSNVVSAFGGWDAILSSVTGALAGVGVALAGMLVLPAVAGMGTAALGALGAALAFLLSPIGLVIAGAALLGAAYATNFGGVRDSINAVASILGGVFVSALNTAGQIASVVLAGIPPLIQAISGPAQTIASTVGSFLVSAFASLGTIAQSVFAGLPGLASTVMGVLTAFGSYVSSTLAGAFQVILPIASSVFAGIATVVSMALPGLFAVANAVGSLLIAAFNALQGVATAVFNAILPYIPGIQAYIAALAVVVGSVLGAAFNWLAGVIRGTVIPAIQTAGAWLAQNLPGAIQVVMNFVTGTLLPGLLNLATWLAQNLPTAIQALSGFWTGVLQPAIATVWGFITGTLFPLFQQLIGWLQTNIPQGLAALSNFWQEHKDQIISIAQTAWDTIKGVIESVLGTITGLWQAFQSAREGDWRGFGEKLRAIWDATWQAISDALSNARDTLASILDNASSTLVDILNRAGESMVNALASIDWAGLGSNIVQGIANGIRGGVSAIADAARGVAQAALDAAKGFLGIQSPSKVMAQEVGVPMAEGIAAGFNAGLRGGDMAGALQQTVGSLVNNARVLSGLREVFVTVADAARDLFDIFANASAGIGGNAVKKIDRLVDTISSISDAVSDMLKMIEVLQDAQKHLDLGGLLGDTGGENQIIAWVNRLVVMGRRMVEAAKQATQNLSQSTVDEFRRLADAIGSVTSIATGAVALIQAMLDALKVDLSGFNTETAAAGLKRLTTIAVSLVTAAAGATAALKGVDTSGLAPLKTAAENALGVVTSTLALVQALGDALRVDWGAVNFADAGRMMHDLAGMIVYFASKAQEAGAALKKVDTTGLAPLKEAADSLTGIADGARAIVARLVDALTIDWAAINWPGAGKMMHDLAVMAVYFVTKAAEAAVAILAIDTRGLAPLAQAAQATLDVATRTMELVKYLVGAMAFDWPSLNADTLVAFVGRLVALGVQLAQAAATAVGTWSTTVKPALADLATVLQSTLTVLDNTFKLVEAVAVGNMAGMTGRDFLGQGPGGISPIQNRLIWLVMVGQQLAQAANDAMGTWSTTVKSALADLGTVLQNALSAISDTFKIVEALAVGNMAGVTGADFAVGGGLGYSPIQNRLIWLVTVGQQLAQAVADAMGEWSITVPAALSALKSVLSDSVGVIHDTVALIREVLTTWQQGWPDIDPEQAAQLVINPLLRLGMALASAAATATASLATLETGGLSKLNDAIGGIQGALEGIPKLLRQILTTWQQGWLDIDPQQAADLVFTPLFRLGIALASAAETAAAGMAGVTTDAVKALSDAVSTVLGAVKNTLDLFKLLTDTLANGPLDMTGAGAHPELVDALVTYAISVANAFLLAANAFTGEVKDGAKALGDALSAALGTAKNALEVLTLFKTTLAGGPLDMSAAGLHPELIDALTTYAISVADAFLLAANAFTGQVTDASKALGDALNAALSTAKNALEILALFSKTLSGGPVDMTTADLHPELIDALATYAASVASAFLGVANAFDGIVTDGAKALGDALGAALGVAKNALDALTLFTKALAGGPLDMTGADLHPELVDALTVYASQLAAAFLAAANGFSGQVSDGAKALKEALDIALGTAKNALDALTLFNTALKNGPLDMTGAGLHAELVDALTTYAIQLATAFLAVANAFDGIVTDAAKALADAMGTALGVVKDALEFADLRAALASFKPLDMATYGPKIDALFAAAKDVALRFVEKAKTANISKDMQDAADALSKVFGDAAGSIKGAIDTAAALLDPGTQIPSIGQIDAKLTAILNLIEAVTQRFAAKASSIGPDTVKSAEGLSSAVKSVFDAISQVIAAVKDAADLYLGTAGFSNIASLMTYLFDLFDQFAGRSEGVNAVTAAITSMLGGIQALVSSAGFTAGQTWASQFAAGISAGTGGVQASAGGAAATIGGGAATRAATATGGGATGTTNIFNAPQTMTQNVTVSLSTAVGLDSTLTLLMNMARGG